MTDSTAKKTIIITRPSDQNHELLNKLSSLPVNTIAFPTIKIICKSNDIPDEYFDFVIFTSANAVKCSNLDWLKSQPQTTVAAIGLQTKKCLIEQGFKKVLAPINHAGSLALLHLPEFNNVNNKSALIVTGESGLNVLQTSLQKKGCRVINNFCYQRGLPNVSSSAIIELMRTPIDLIVCTSNACLDNLMIMIKNNKNHILNSQIIGFSSRIIPLAKKYGFAKPPIIAEHTSNDGLYEAINHYLQGINHD